MSSPLLKREVENLFRLEAELAKAAAGFDLDLVRAPSTIKTHLLSQPSELISSVANSLSQLLRSFIKCAQEGVDPWDDREFFALSMRAIGMTYPADFLKHVSHNDLIEGYDMNRIQIFRNMRFMETSSYSLMEILSYAWPLLFDRPSVITDKIISYCDGVLWAANKTIQIDVPLHFMHEIRSPKRQVCEVKFKCMAPLFSGPNQPSGVLATCTARVIDADAEKDNLTFL